jgi:hypothetical protein
VRSWTAQNISPGEFVGLVDSAKFEISMTPRIRNAWRPLFRGTYKPSEGKVEVDIVCGVSLLMAVLTWLFQGIVFLLLISSIVSCLSQQKGLSAVFPPALFFAFSIFVPRLAFFTEFRLIRPSFINLLKEAGSCYDRKTGQAL